MFVEISGSHIRQGAPLLMVGKFFAFVKNALQAEVRALAFFQKGQTQHALKWINEHDGEKPCRQTPKTKTRQQKAKTIRPLSRQTQNPHQQYIHQRQWSGEICHEDTYHQKQQPSPCHRFSIGKRPAQRQTRPNRQQIEPITDGDAEMWQIAKSNPPKRNKENNTRQKPPPEPLASLRKKGFRIGCDRKKQKDGKVCHCHHHGDTMMEKLHKKSCQEFGKAARFGKKRSHPRGQKTEETFVFHVFQPRIKKAHPSRDQQGRQGCANEKNRFERLIRKTLHKNSRITDPTWL